MAVRPVLPCVRDLRPGLVRLEKSVKLMSTVSKAKLASSQVCGFGVALPACFIKSFGEVVVRFIVSASGLRQTSQLQIRVLLRTVITKCAREL